MVDFDRFWGKKTKNHYFSEMLNFWAKKWILVCWTETLAYYRIGGAKDGFTLKNAVFRPSGIFFGSKT